MNFLFQIIGRVNNENIFKEKVNIYYIISIMDLNLLYLSVGTSYGWFYFVQSSNLQNTYLYIFLSLAYGGIGFYYGYSFFMNLIKTAEESIVDPPTPYEEFIDMHYDEMKEIMEAKEIDIDLDKLEYENNDEDYLKSLSQKEQHFESELPFDYKNCLIFFYHYDEKRFHYYTKGDVTYPVVNSVCRGYVIDKKCMQLFKDEADLSRIQKMIDDEYENISDQESEEEEEEEEEKEELNSIFYFKKFDKKQKKINKKKKEKIINLFLRKGNLEDYKNDFPEKQYAEKTETKDISYEAFKNLMNRCADS